MLRILAGGQVRQGVVQHDRDAGGGRYSVRTYRRNASSSPRRTIGGSPMPSSSLIGRISTCAAISPPSDEVNHDSLGHQRLIMGPGQTLRPRH
jgi:hypothetical protein